MRGAGVVALREASCTLRVRIERKVYHEENEIEGNVSMRMTVRICMCNKALKHEWYV